jgi:hypothetical protein
MESENIKLKLKWNKDIFELEVSPHSNIGDFRIQAYSLTSVPVEK